VSVRRSVLAAALVAALLSFAAVSARATAPTFQELEESLTCQCGCGLTVHSCNHLQCGSALPLRDEIRAQMAEGKDKEAILAHFREKYGEKILSSPTTTGFNLAAWITPFLAVAAGGLLIGLMVLRWGRRGEGAEARPAAPPATAASKEHQKILERELERFER